MGASFRRRSPVTHRLRRVPVELVRTASRSTRPSSRSRRRAALTVASGVGEVRRDLEQEQEQDRHLHDRHQIRVLGALPGGSKSLRRVI